MRPFVDVGLVARFEILRAVRSWQAVALALGFLVANVGAAYLFVEVLGTIENGIAEQLGVAPTRWPGALSEQLRESEALLEMLSAFTGDEVLARRVAQAPLLAVFQLWQGIVFVPFLLASASAEALSGDVRSRAIRFEALRTGRGELVVGRFVGQVALGVGALALALPVVAGLGLGLMVGQQPLALFVALVTLGGRALIFALPFAGLGLACSALTTSPAWARVLALSGTAGSWVLYGVLRNADDGAWAVLADVLLPLLPQGWIEGLWAGGVDLALASTVSVALAALGVGVAWAVVQRSDL